MRKLLLGVGVWVVLIAFGVLAFFMAASADNGVVNVDQDPLSVNVANREKLQAEIDQMRAEIKANGWQFTVGANPAMQYSLDQLCGTRPELKPPTSAAIEPGEAGNRLSTRVVARLPGNYTGYYTPIKDQAS